MTPGAALHRDPALDAATGGLLRPGGLALTDRALAHCALAPGAAVLDAGCGLGTAVAHLRGRRGLAAVGLDLDGVLLRRAAQRHPGAPLLRGTFTALPLRDGAVAAVLLECCLSLVAAPGALLAECHRVLQPGGRLVVTDLYARREAALPPGPGCGARPRTLAALQAALASAGFSPRVVEDHSRALGALLAGAVLGGAPGAPGALLADRGALRAARPGYLLLVAEREATGGPCHAC